MKHNNKIKAEPFDIMQYFYREVHDPLIHCLMQFSAPIEEKTLIKAVTCSLNAIPLIGCCFDDSSRRPSWVKRNFKGEDIVHLVNAEPNEIMQCERLLISTIDIYNEPQLKMFLIKTDNCCDKMCLIINHMVCDGAGLKEYLYLLADIYAHLENDIDYKIQLDYNSRSINSLFKSINFLGKINLMFSKYHFPVQVFKDNLPISKVERKPFFVLHVIIKEDFNKIILFSKQMNVTINDIILTSYIRFLHKHTKTNRIVMPCPVDLRKYLSINQKHGICNLTGNYYCDVNIKKEDTFCDTLYKISQQMKSQKENNKCLKPLINLQLAFKILSFRYLKSNFYNYFTIPVISYSNLGVLDKNLLNFGSVAVDKIFLTGAIKNKPYFQLTVSTYDNNCVLSCNRYGTPFDKYLIKSYLKELKDDILVNCIF